MSTIPEMCFLRPTAFFDPWHLTSAWPFPPFSTRRSPSFFDTIIHCGFYVDFSAATASVCTPTPSTFPPTPSVTTTPHLPLRLSGIPRSPICLFPPVLELLPFARGPFRFLRSGYPPFLPPVGLHPSLNICLLICPCAFSVLT